MPNSQPKQDQLAACNMEADGTPLSKDLSRSRAGLLVELAAQFATTVLRAPNSGLCCHCRGYRDTRTSPAQYPNIFCSERCEQEFVGAALASLTLDDCIRMTRQLDRLLVKAQGRTVCN